jgi:hypothetical protein
LFADGRYLVIDKQVARWEALSAALACTVIAPLLQTRGTSWRLAPWLDTVYPVTFRRDRAVARGETMACLGLFAILNVAGLGWVAAIDAILRIHLARPLVWFVDAVTISVVAVLGLLLLKYNRRRTKSVVVVHKDRVEIVLGSHVQAAHFVDVASIRVLEKNKLRFCELETFDGAKTMIDVGDATFERIYPLLRFTLMPILVSRVDAELARGGTMAVRERRAGFWRQDMSWLVARDTGWGLESTDEQERAARSARVRRRRRRGGFTISAAGIARISDAHAPAMSWNELVIQELDEAGIEIEATDGERFTASPYAENYLPAVAWLTQTCFDMELDDRPAEWEPAPHRTEPVRRVSSGT